ncbi:nucleotidyltransferase domain-containing protein [Clostridium cylindrosporum]|uniref:Polymerase beta nucleotidyltransferase domain-containing protein n=1 Tax=Clostridium cylindrosporum DSM 605 TaxID=1121307 RepID=A0A0J8D5W6_CLOCY|nr:nucleotidyltransferase domain-containing protein [Clostridium cylindrosporum]KMT21247.1 hypothetical protein CLCY_2c00070 [Clostridium cylindrosporum DSM 605]
MSKIREYQKAYEKALQSFRGCSHTLAVIVYGSIVNGDIWQESDIDFIVVTSEKDKMEILYTKAYGIYMHIKYISKEKFINNFESIVKGGTFHKAFSSGKLVYCNDCSIEELFHSTRFYSDRDRKIRNIDILSEMLNLMHYAKKFYFTKKYETAYELTLLVFKNFARLNMNLSGYITDKDVISIAINMNSSIENLFKTLVYDGDLEDRIITTLKYIESFIEKNIAEITEPIVEFIKNSKEACSVMDIQESKEFNCINKDLSLVIHEMAKNKVVWENTRDYKTQNGEFLIHEIVYSV